MELNSNTVEFVPANALVNNGSVMPAWRVAGLDRVGVEAALQTPAGFYISEDGVLTAMFQGDDRRYVWETEFLPRLGPSVACRVCLDEYPDGRCYSASEWVDERGARLFVFERFGT